MAAENSLADQENKERVSESYVKSELGLKLKYKRKRPQDTYTLTSTLNDKISREEKSYKKQKPWSHSIETIEAKLKGTSQTNDTALLKKEVDD